MNPRIARALGATLLLLAAASCSVRAPHPDAFSFAVVGDTPYHPGEEERFVEMMADLDRAKLAFVVHVGDFKGGEKCTDALYARRLAQFQASAHPLVYTPGDNEWTDCRRPYMGSMDPIERLARLRAMFFATPRSLGRATIETAVQASCGQGSGACRCAALPENRAWSRAGVQFMTLHVVGSDNNVGFDAANDAEAACRDAANGRWLDEVAGQAQRSGARALVIAMQANPWDSKKPVFDRLRAQIVEVARRLDRPVLLIHGDSHTQRVDHPFRDAMGDPVRGITRMETYGSPFVGWVRVDVDPGAPEVFSFVPTLKAFVLPALRD